MLNQIVIVGRLLEKPDIKELENGKKICIFTLKVPRSWKNSDGEYENDLIDCIAFSGIAENIKEYCEENDLIGIKGRVEKLNKNENLRIIAEKVTYLSSNKNNDGGNN